MADVCNLTYMITQPTRISMRANNVNTSCIDLIFANTYKLWSEAVSVAVGCSDHNLIEITKKTKTPRVGTKIALSRSYKRFNQELFTNEIQREQWTGLCREKDVNAALNTFMDTINKLIDKHAPLRKRLIKARNCSALWLDYDLKALMLQRDKAKEAAHKSGNDHNTLLYRKIRNKVTKLNHVKRKTVTRIKEDVQLETVNDCGKHSKK